MMLLNVHRILKLLPIHTPQQFADYHAYSLYPTQFERQLQAQLKDSISLSEKIATCQGAFNIHG